MPVSLVQRGPFSYDEYTNISSSDASTRTFTLTNAKFDSTIGEVLEVFVDGVKLVGDGTFVTGGTNPGTGASAHEFSVNSAQTQLTIVSDNDLFNATDSEVQAVSAGNDILIRRVSDRSAKKVDFAPGSVIREADLDNANTQVFHVAQEAIDTALQAMVTDTDNRWNGQVGNVNRNIKNVAEPGESDPDHYVATKGYVDGSSTTVTVAGSIANVNAVAGQITPTNNIATVADSGYKTDIETVADSTYKGKVETVGDSTYKSKVETVADSTYKGKVETVAESVYKGKVETVADSTYKSKVETVADNDANVTKVANVDANVTKVANIDSDVTTVANNDANVTKVANIDSDVTTVAGLGTNGAHVTTVATNNANVTAVANNIADVNNFADTYFGTSSSPSGPTGTFTAGDLYFSTYNSENKLKVYNGSSWQNATSAVEGIATITEFTPNGSDTHFAFTHDVGLQIVFLNGVRLIQGTDYNSVNSSSSTSNITSGTASHLHFSTPPANGDVLSAMGFGTVTSTAVVPVSGGTFSGNVTVPNLIIDDGGNIGSASDTDALTIDSSGNVGIGGSPAARLHVETSGNTGIQIRSGTTTSNGFINFNDGATAKGQIFYDHNGDYMRLYVNSAERMRIHSGGNVELKTTNANLILPSGGGIDFGNQTNTGSSISNQVLEHYERGIFTPTIFTASNSNFAGSGTSGVYLRIGEWITVGMIIQNISWPTSNTSESVSVGGLPFASGEDALGYGWSNIVAYTNTDMNNTLALTTGTSSTVGRFRFSTSTNTNATIADFNTYSSPTRIDLSLSYLAT